MIPDHRGTGRSSPLYCTDYSVATDPACIAAALQRYSNATLAQFSVSNAARDINAAMDLTALADGKVYLYGVSYGTYLLQRCVTSIIGCRVSTGGYCEVEWPWLQNLTVTIDVICLRLPQLPAAVSVGRGCGSTGRHCLARLG